MYRITGKSIASRSFSNSKRCLVSSASSDIFGINCFTPSVMGDYLDRKTLDGVLDANKYKKRWDEKLIKDFSVGVERWAIDRGNKNSFISIKIKD